MAIKLTASRAELRDPSDSQVPRVRVEDAGDCDGSVCGLGGKDESGVWCYPDPHYHLVESGLMPEAGPRIYAI
jgi:hypothetical protein